MKRVLLALLIVTLLSVPAMGQDTTRHHLFGGFSYGNIDTAQRENASGFQGSYTHHFDFKHTKRFDITADFGGQFGSTQGVDFQIYQFLFGPQITRQLRQKYSAFAHALVGVAHARTSSTTIVFMGIPITIPATSDTGLAFGFGGGIDVKLSERVSLRAVQADYIPAKLGDWTHNLRVGVGLIFKVGGS